MKNRGLKIKVGVYLTFLWLGLSVVTASAQTASSNKKPAEKMTETSAMANLAWRSIGPANMGGRIADIEGVPGDPNTVYVATGSGGIFKTTNGGMKWTPIFDRQNTISVGDIA
ncbi:MAG: hypothetical protein M3388_10280, partial [Acidobacteriota bacterium]|nr:hypothetical protein [Acidobacteriota bacterium]